MTPSEQGRTWEDMAVKRNMVYQSALLALALILLLGYQTARQLGMDKQGPGITVSTDPLERSVRAPREAYLQGVTAIDDLDGDVTDLIVVESVYGMTPDRLATVTYAAFDRSGNVTKAQRQIRFGDYHSPRFCLNQALVFPSTSGVDVMDFIGAEDLFDGDMVRRVRATLISNSGTLSDPGIHDVKLQVTNSLGDTSELILPVEVYPPEKFNATLTLTDYLIYLPKGASFWADSYPDTVSFAGRTYDLSDNPAGVTVSVSGSVNTQIPGLYAVTYTVTCDGYGSTGTGCSRLFVVVEE